MISPGRAALCLVLLMAADGAVLKAADVDVDAQSLVVAADKVRNPGQPFQSTATLTEYDNGKPQSQIVLTIYVKVDPATKQFRNLIRYVEPARDAGKAFLVNGRSMWFFDPASNASIRISPHSASSDRPQ